MSDLISREAMIERLQAWNRNDAMDKALYDFAMNRIIEQPTIEAVPLNEIYRLIAGHSDYHGDNILAALTCVAEGKKVTPVRPIEAVPVVHGEWKKYTISKLFSCTCSVCNCDAEEKTPFCPNCGADMRKGGA